MRKRACPCSNICVCMSVCEGFQFQRFSCFVRQVTDTTLWKYAVQRPATAKTATLAVLRSRHIFFSRSSYLALQGVRLAGETWNETTEANANEFRSSKAAKTSERQQCAREAHHALSQNHNGVQTCALIAIVTRVISEERGVTSHVCVEGS